MGCARCAAGNYQSWCPTNKKFKALTKCVRCNCVDGEESSCDESPWGRPCNPMEIGLGGNNYVKWQRCTNIGSVNNMIVDWDENEFGKLDEFEKCAHEYHDDAENHGGHKALDCMQILLNAAKSERRDIISNIAAMLYINPSGMCDCSSSAWTSVPSCSTFTRVKTLVHETLDACKSLDWIDCDAWREFSDTCMINVKSEFPSVDFSKEKQCKYVLAGCGGAGPFPTFRRLDCRGQIPKDNWDFWVSFSVGCSLDGDGDDSGNGGDGDHGKKDKNGDGDGDGDGGDKKKKKKKKKKGDNDHDRPGPKPIPDPSPLPDPDDGGSDPSSSSGGALRSVLTVLSISSLVIGLAYLYRRKIMSDRDALAGAYRYRKQRNDGDGMEVNRGGSFVPPTFNLQHDI